MRVADSVHWHAWYADVWLIAMARMVCVECGRTVQSSTRACWLMGMECLQRSAASHYRFSSPNLLLLPLLREHWLRVPERIQFRLWILTYRCLHGSAPPYLAETLHLTSDMESRRRLRSGSTSSLMVPPSRRATLGDRAFPVAAARARNSLPTSVRFLSSYLTFRRSLKSLLFVASFQDDWT